MWKFTQRSWVGGRLDSELMGRQDLAKYFQGASELKNFTVRRQGNVSKRRGTMLAADLENLLGRQSASEGHAALAVADASALATLATALGCTVSGSDLVRGSATVGTWDASTTHVTLSNAFFDIDGTAAYELSLKDATYYAMHATSGDYIRRIVPTATGTAAYFETCDLQQHPLVKIGSARIVHLLRSETDGYYLLFTAGRIFILNRSGIRLRNGTYVSRIPEFNDSDYSVTSSSATGYRADIPYCATSGIGDNFIGEIKYAQSGDTLIFVSHYFAPKKLVFDGETISVSALDFSNTTWARPIVTSVQAKADCTWGTGATKTVYYACTYVKDGIESPMSDPKAFSYQLPWGNTCVVQITVSRGNNAVEPDYYNIYKQESSGYGLIATSGATITVDVTPAATSSGVNLSIAQLSRPKNSNYVSGSTVYYTVTGFTEVVAGNEASSFVGSVPATHLLVDETYSSAYWKSGNWYYSNVVHGNTRFSGGINSGSTLTFDFGSASGVKVTDIKLAIDAATFFSDLSYGLQGMLFYYSGNSFEITLTTKNAAGETWSPTTRTVTSTAPNAACVAGANLVTSQVPTSSTTQWSYGDYNHIASNWDAISSSSWMRTISADFYSEIAAHYTDSSAQDWWTTKIEVKAYQNNTACNVYWCGVKFANTSAQQNVYEDDYITPDLSCTPPESESHFVTVTDYPACVGFYKQRLCFANTLADPFKFWMSSIGDLYNFNVHATLVESDAISATLAALEFPDINHIVVCRDVLMLTGGSEWKVAPVSGNTLSYKTVSADCQSYIGSSKRLVPMLVGDEIVFADRNGTRLYATKYNWSTDGYDSSDLSVLSQGLFKNNAIADMAYSQYPDSTVDCVLADGTLATLVYMKEHEVCAWALTVLGGGWSAKGVACAKTNVNGSSDEAILVERDGIYQVWSVMPDIPVREANPSETLPYVHMDALHEVLSGEVLDDDMTAVNCNGTQYAGYLFEAELVTVRPEPVGGSETIQFEVKNAKDTEIRVLDSGDFTVNAYGDADHAQAVSTGGAIDATDGAITLATKDCRTVLFGSNGGDGRIQVKSETALPLNILSVSVNYEIQPLSGSEG